MGRKYKRKTDPVDREALHQAVLLYKRGEISFHGAAKAYGISTATLIRHYRKEVHHRAVQGRFGVFTKAQEDEIASYLVYVSSRFYGCTRYMLAQKAYQLAVANGIPYPKSWDTRRRAGIDWVYGFLNRYKNLSIRTSARLNQARVNGFTRINVDQFFDNLERVLEQNPGITAARIFNMDETGTSIVPTKAPKVIAPRGSRSVHTIKHGERGKLVTIVSCFNADGSLFMPPMFVFSRNTQVTDEQLIRGPVGCISEKSTKGWSTACTFSKWLHHFHQYVNPSKEDPVILVLDNHSSHINLDAIDFAIENGIHMVTIPPHTTGRMQPLDIGFYGPLKRKYGDAMYAWTVENPGKKPGEGDVPQIIRNAYNSCCYRELAMNAFNKCGIWVHALGRPSRYVFSDDDFMNAASSYTYDPPAPPPNSPDHSPDSPGGPPPPGNPSPPGGPLPPGGDLPYTRRETGNNPMERASSAVGSSTLEEQLYASRPSDAPCTSQTPQVDPEVTTVSRDVIMSEIIRSEQETSSQEDDNSESYSVTAHSPGYSFDQEGDSHSDSTYLHFLEETSRIGQEGAAMAVPFSSSEPAPLNLMAIPPPPLCDNDEFESIIIEPPLPFRDLTPRSSPSLPDLQSSTSIEHGSTKLIPEYSLVARSDFEDQYDELSADFNTPFSEIEFQALEQECTGREKAQKSSSKIKRDQSEKFLHSPLELNPLPFPTPLRRARKGQKSEVLTSDQFMRSLEQKELQKLQAKKRKEPGSKAARKSSKKK